MSAKSHDPHPRGTRVRDKDGDTWRKGTAWWHWEQRGQGLGDGPGKMLGPALEREYGPLTVIQEQEQQR